VWFKSRPVVPTRSLSLNQAPEKGAWAEGLLSFSAAIRSCSAYKWS
jgi:hypothetical protein